MKSRKENYLKLEEFQPGHDSLELVAKELKGCFGNPDDAEEYLASCLDLNDEAIRLSSNH